LGGEGGGGGGGGGIGAVMYRYSGDNLRYTWACTV